MADNPVTEFEREAAARAEHGPLHLSVGRVILLVVTAVSLYLLAPSIGEVFSAWDRLGDFNPIALPLVLLLETLSFGCVWLLQAIALRSERYDAVILSQLAGNAFNRVTPGGGATGTALQARMLAPRLKARPKQVAQRDHHLPGLRHVGVHDGRDSVQRVEEEVGLHLRP